MNRRWQPVRHKHAASFTDDCNETIRPFSRAWRAPCKLVAALGTVCPVRGAYPSSHESSHEWRRAKDSGSREAEDTQFCNCCSHTDLAHAFWHCTSCAHVCTYALQRLFPARIPPDTILYIERCCSTFRLRCRAGPAELRRMMRHDCGTCEAAATTAPREPRWTVTAQGEQEVRFLELLFFSSK